MIVRYDKSWENVWDHFVKNTSLNGSFLQMRCFLNYHKNRFVDHSLIFLKGQEVVAVMPACEGDGGERLISHAGATFGGIVIGKEWAKLSEFQWILEELETYVVVEGFKELEIRMPSWLYQSNDFHMEILDFILKNHGFNDMFEVGFYMDLQNMDEDFEKYYAPLRRRKLKKAGKNGLQFKLLKNDDDKKEFYNVLEDNYRKFETHPVHSYEEMRDLEQHCIPGNLFFYGVFLQDIMIAGSMVFDFNEKKTFHTQYLASKRDYLEYCPNEFLYTNLIKESRKLGYRFISFGNATLEHGAVLNENLALFKESFNMESYINKTYIKKY